VQSCFLDAGPERQARFIEPMLLPAVLDKALALNVVRVVPDHSAAGGGEMVAAERKFIAGLRDGALELKRKGVAVDEAGRQLGVVFKGKYPDWPGMNVRGS
jgi:hypothetical protein